MRKLGPPKSQIPNEIIKLLGNKERRFSELKDLLNVSKPTLWKNLTLLVNDGTIDYVKKGREKYYKIIDKPSKSTERKIPKLSFGYESSMSLWSLFYETDKSSIKEAFGEIGNMLNSLFLFCLLKSIETGENWLEAFDPKASAKNSLMILLFGLLSETGVKAISFTPYLDKVNLEEFFKEINNKLMKDKKIQANLKQMFEVLKMKYPKEIKALELVYSKL